MKKKLVLTFFESVRKTVVNLHSKRQRSGWTLDRARAVELWGRGKGQWRLPGGGRRGGGFLWLSGQRSRGGRRQAQVLGPQAGTQVGLSQLGQLAKGSLPLSRVLLNWAGRPVRWGQAQGLLAKAGSRGDAVSALHHLTASTNQSQQWSLLV